MSKLVRFQVGESGPRYGRLDDGGTIIDVLAAPAWQGGGQPTGERVPLEVAALLAPCEPTKVVCVGRNYVAHAKELGNEPPPEPLIFIKPPSSVIGPAAAIVRPRASSEVHHEAELGVVIGQRSRRVTAAEARRAIAGFTCVNDITARDIQAAEKHFTRCKGFDTFCPIGPWIEDGPLDVGALRVRCRVNEQVRQDSQTAAMVVDPFALIAFISSVMTLEPGDVVSTGTPAGVGPLVAGDVVHVEVTGVGILTNPVRDEP